MHNEGRQNSNPAALNRGRISRRPRSGSLAQESGWQAVIMQGCTPLLRPASFRSVHLVRVPNFA